MSDQTKALLQEMMEAVEKSLPAQVGNALKARLEEADSSESEVARLKKQLAAMTAELATAKRDLEDFKNREKRTDELAKREQELKHQEEMFAVEKACSKEVLREVKGIIGIVFSNNILKRTVFTSQEALNSQGYKDNLSGSTDITGEQS